MTHSVQRLFGVAQGALLYSWLFYPLFRLGEEQLYRVVESAARVRYQELSGSETKLRFVEVIAGLVESGVIPAKDEPRWQGLRELRNRSAHPEDQVVMPPGAVLVTLKAPGHDINRIFARQPRGQAPPG